MFSIGDRTWSCVSFRIWGIGPAIRRFFFPRKKKTIKQIACVASVSVRFRRKERGTTVKDRAKNGASKRAGRGWRGKEGNFPSPSPHFHCLALVSFLARPKPRIPFLGLFLLRNQTETLATQAINIVVTSREKK